MLTTAPASSILTLTHMHPQLQHLESIMMYDALLPWVEQHTLSAEVAAMSHGRMTAKGNSDQALWFTEPQLDLKLLAFLHTEGEGSATRIDPNRTQINPKAWNTGSQDRQAPSCGCEANRTSPSWGSQLPPKTAPGG